MPSRRLSDALSIASFAGLCLVVSLGVYSRSTTGVQDDDFGFSVAHYVMGLPGWLELNVFRPEHLSSLDDSRSFARAADIPLAWHVRPWPLAVSVGACLLLSAIVVGLNRACCARVCKEHVGRLALGMGIGVMSALVVGCLVPTKPEWIGVCLGLGALPLCIIFASAIMRDYMRAVGLGFLMAVAVIWSQRLAAVFGVPGGIQSPPITDDLPVVVTFGAYYAAVALVATFATMLLRKWAGHAEPSDAAASRERPAE